MKRLTDEKIIELHQQAYGKASRPLVLDKTDFGYKLLDAQLASCEQECEARIKEMRWDIEALNELLRAATGMGQGEIDSEAEDIKIKLKAKYGGSDGNK